MSTHGDDYPADVKAPLLDPAAAPEYTPLPASPQDRHSPAASVLTYAGEQPPVVVNADGEHDAACAEGLTIMRLLWTGVLALVIPPAIVAAAAIACAGAMLYGTGKVLEGFGRGLAVAPEWVYKKVVVAHGKRLARKVRGRVNLAADDVEGGPIAL